MPRHAGVGAVSSILPLAHLRRDVRGVLLKGNGWQESLPHLWPLALFLGAMRGLGLLRYRCTLD
jgi:ABC-2 type transport system permease protein